MAVVSCGILVLNRHGEILLCRATGTSRWDIPKGIAEPGESPREAAVRETREETGLDFGGTALLDLGRHAYRKGKDLHLHATLAERFDPSACRCTTTFVDRHGRRVPEMNGFEWVPFDAVPARCGRSLAELLVQRVPLQAVLQRLAPPAG